MFIEKVKQITSRKWVERVSQVIPGDADLVAIKALMESYRRDDIRIIEIASAI